MSGGCPCHGQDRPDYLAAFCDCPGCMALRGELAEDGTLDPHLGCHLLIRGWAGGYTRGEKAYVRAHSPSVQAAIAKARQNASFSGTQRKSERPSAE